MCLLSIALPAAEAVAGAGRISLKAALAPEKESQQGAACIEGTSIGAGAEGVSQPLSRYICRRCSQGFNLKGQYNIHRKEGCRRPDVMAQCTPAELPTQATPGIPQQLQPNTDPLVVLCAMVRSAGGSLDGSSLGELYSKLPEAKGLIKAAGGLKQFCEASQVLLFDTAQGRITSVLTTAKQQHVLSAAPKPTPKQPHVMPAAHKPTTATPQQEMPVAPKPTSIPNQSHKRGSSTAPKPASEGNQTQAVERSGLSQLVKLVGQLTEQNLVPTSLQVNSAVCCAC